MKHRGVHLLSDVVGASGRVMGGAGFMVEFLKGAAKRGGATVVSEGAVDLASPPGFTVFVGLDESHISAHYYEAGGHLAVDVFTCGVRADARRIMGEILGEVGGRVVFESEVRRFPQETGQETDSREGQVEGSTRGLPAVGARRENDSGPRGASGFCGGTVGVGADEGAEVGDEPPEIVESAAAWSGGSDRLKAVDPRDEDTVILEGGGS